MRVQPANQREMKETFKDAMLASHAADGLGNLLYQVHSKHFTSIIFHEEETNLQFYEHVGECDLAMSI